MVGVASLAVSSFIYARTRYRLLMYYIAYLFSLTLFVFSYLFVLSYANLNYEQINFNLLISIVLVSLLSYLLLMLSLPFFDHALVLEISPGKRNIAVIAVSITAFAAVASSLKIDLAGKDISQVQDFRLYLSLALFYSMIAYSILLKILSLKRFNGEHKRITKALIILEIIFIPGFIYDLYLYRTHNVFVFTPIIYGFFAVLFTVYIAKRYVVQLKSIPADIASVSYDDIFSRTGISSREQEIVYLILQGLGNRDIAKQLFISPNTVKTHIRNIFRKMDVKSRFELAMTLKNSRSE
jgi:DNA-binding CsgD family transcriptional regulator